VIPGCSAGCSPVTALSAATTSTGAGNPMLQANRPQETSLELVAGAVRLLRGASIPEKHRYGGVTMKVIIVGIGRVGSSLANMLDREGHQVTVVDRDALALQRRLSPDFSGTKLVGNAMDQDVLERAGIRQADVLLTITEGDNRNIMIAQIAKVVFGVPKVMARIVDPLRAQAYRELGIESIDQTTLVSEHMRRVVLGETASELAAQREE